MEWSAHLPLEGGGGVSVTHVGNYHYWALLTLSRDHYFRYRECTGGRLSLEAAFRRKPDCGFGIFILYNMY